MEKLKPLPTQLGRLRLTLRQSRLGPYRHALGLLFQPLQPDEFGGKNMGHQLQRSLVCAAGASDRVQNFPVRPLIIRKLAAQIISKVHELPSVTRLPEAHPM